MKFASRIEKQEISGIRKSLHNAPENSINLALGEIQLAIPEKLRDYISLLSNDMYYCGYTENKGLKELRNTISDYYDGLYQPENICVTTGAEEALFVSLMSLLEKGDRIALADPSYSAYRNLAEITGAEIIYFPLNDDFTFNTDFFISTLDRDVKAVLINNPSNPTSKSFTSDEMKVIAEECRNRGIILIVDEIYLDLVFKKRHSFSYYGNDIIIVSGISKAFAVAGCRLGWVTGSAEFISKVTIMHQYVVSCAPFMSQKIAVYALNHREIIQELLGKLKNNYQIIAEYFKNEGINYIVPDAAPYLLVEINGSDQEIASILKNQGILVVPGSFFGKKSAGFVRLNYAVEKSLLVVALERIQKNIHNFRKHPINAE